MTERKLIVICVVATLLPLVLPVAGANAVGEMESGYILFRGFNLIEVSRLGIIPVRCAFLTILVLTLCKMPSRAKAHTLGLLAVLACIGWIGGTIAARDFLMRMESIEPIIVRYDVGLPLGLASNIAMMLVALLHSKRAKQKTLF